MGLAISSWNQKIFGLLCLFLWSAIACLCLMGCSNTSSGSLSVELQDPIPIDFRIFVEDRLFDGVHLQPYDELVLQYRTSVQGFPFSWQPSLLAADASNDSTNQTPLAIYGMTAHPDEPMHVTAMVPLPATVCFEAATYEVGEWDGDPFERYISGECANIPASNGRVSGDRLLADIEALDLEQAIDVVIDTRSSEDLHTYSRLPENADFVDISFD